MLATVWQIEQFSGSAGDFHQRDLPDVITPTVWWFDVDHSTVALGSSQPISDIDAAACAQAGIDIVRRRSGGGAVLLEPGDVVWVDVLIPAGHRQWSTDVSSSAWWLGEAWRSALSSLGMPGLSVHTAPIRHTEWSRRICFAGVGGGEVMLGDRKVVGISQRRVRAGARFQCAYYQQWRPAIHELVFGSSGPRADELLDLVAPVSAPAAAVREAFVHALNSLG
jgi:lipoate-protein ligase A